MAEMQELIIDRWNDVLRITDDIDDQVRGRKGFTVSEMINYLKPLLPVDKNKKKVNLTKAKIDTRRDTWKLISPVNIGERKKRAVWRYTPRDVRIVLLFELLSAETSPERGYGLEDIKRELLSFIAQDLPAKPPPPTNVRSTYMILQNRTLAALLLEMNDSQREDFPEKVLLGLKIIDEINDSLTCSMITSWSEAKFALETQMQFFAASISRSNLFMYSGLADIRKTNVEIADSIELFEWYSIVFNDYQLEKSYHMIIGCSLENKASHLRNTLDGYANSGYPLDLRDFDGISVLLHAAFSTNIDLHQGSKLEALSEIIAKSSDRWDYCIILGPNENNALLKPNLISIASSSKTPLELENASVQDPNILRKWKDLYRKGFFLEEIIPNDPRIPLQDNPEYVAIMPAISKGRIFGLLYIAKQRRADVLDAAQLSEEDLLNLQAFSYICGDILGRTETDNDTVQNIAGLTSETKRKKQIIEFDSISEVVSEIRNIFDAGISPQLASRSWWYLVTLNIEFSPLGDEESDILKGWLEGKTCKSVTDYLIDHVLNGESTKIGFTKYSDGQFVFGLNNFLQLPESEFKQKIGSLQEELNTLEHQWNHAAFYPWGVTIPYSLLRREFLSNKRKNENGENFVRKIIENAVSAGIFISKGHLAFNNRDNHSAITSFKIALQRGPGNWYVYKHLAEAYLQDGALELAIENCTEAININKGYGSAYCLLGDCYFLNGEFLEGMKKYEYSTKLERRPDFYIRYGCALAGLSQTEFEILRTELIESVPHISETHISKDLHQYAMDKFDKADSLIERNDETSDQKNQRKGMYYFHRGLAQLRPGLLEKALQEFEYGRVKLPDDPRLTQMIFHTKTLIKLSKQQKRRE